MNLQSDITTIKGVGEKSATLFAKLNIHTVKDLLFFFPRDYETFTEPVLISEAKPGELVTIRGIVMLAPHGDEGKASVHSEGEGKGCVRGGDTDVF